MILLSGSASWSTSAYATSQSTLNTQASLLLAKAIKKGGSKSLIKPFSTWRNISECSITIHHLTRICFLLFYTFLFSVCHGRALLWSSHPYIRQFRDISLFPIVFYTYATLCYIAFLMYCGIFADSTTYDATLFERKENYYLSYGSLSALAFCLSSILCPSAFTSFSPCSSVSTIVLIYI